MSEAAAWVRSRPLVDATAFAVAAIVLLRFDVGIAGVVAAASAFVLVVLSAIDLEERRLPNRIVLPAAAGVLVARLATAPEHWLLWLVATFAPALGLLVLALVYPAGLGMGDVKLALLLGATLGGAVVTGLLIGTFSAAVVGLALVLRDGAAARRRAIAYGPYLAFGAIVALILATPGA